MLAPGTSGRNAAVTKLLRETVEPVGILPGGRGSFEAAFVLTLKVIGVPVRAALAATLVSTDSASGYP